MKKVDLRELLQYSDENRLEIFKSHGRTLESAEKDVQSIQNWLTKTNHLPKCITKNQIQIFLVLNKFSIERTKQKFDLFYTWRSCLPQFYRDTYVSSVRAQNAMENFCTLPLPKLWNNQRLYVAGLFNKNPNVMDVQGLTTNCCRIVDVQLNNDFCAGGVVLMDCDGFTFSHLTKINFLILKEVYMITEKVYSGRVHSIHIIRPLPAMETFLNVLKTFMRTKFYERFHIHQTFDSLHKIIDKEYLPVDFGGTDMSLRERKELWKTVLIDFEEAFQEINQFKIDDSLRVSMMNDDILGYQGSFRTLDVD